MKLNLFHKFIGWIIIKPIMRRSETIETLEGMAQLEEKKMTKNMKVVQQFAKEILKEIK